MKPLKILIILPSLAGGGAEKVILSLIENLDTSNYKPTLVIQNKHIDYYINKLPLNNLMAIANRTIPKTFLKIASPPRPIFFSIHPESLSTIKTNIKLMMIPTHILTV